MPLTIDGTYEQLTSMNPEAVFYMEIVEGRNDNFIIAATLAGGAIMRVTVPQKPARFAQDFPQAAEVESINVT